MGDIYIGGTKQSPSVAILKDGKAFSLVEPTAEEKAGMTIPVEVVKDKLAFVNMAGWSGATLFANLTQVKLKLAAEKIEKEVAVGLMNGQMAAMK